MNQNYFLVGAMELLQKLNEITNKRGWFINVDADGKQYFLFATKDSVGSKEMPTTYPLGDCAMTVEELFYTITVLLLTEQRRAMQKGIAYNDAVADYIQTVG